MPKPCRAANIVIQTLLIHSPVVYQSYLPSFAGICGFPDSLLLFETEVMYWRDEWPTNADGSDCDWKRLLKLIRISESPFGAALSNFNMPPETVEK